MTVIKKYSEIINKPLISQLIFWWLIFLFSANSSSLHYENTLELLETYAFRVSFQIATAIICIHVLIPRLLNKGHVLTFILSIMLTLALLFLLCNIIRMNYLELKYPETYIYYIRRFEDPSSLWSRITHLPEFLSISLYFSYPTFLLLAIRFYKDQQRLIKLNEQKKTTELAVLKNQLNPHFLFNTLNNLYALTYKKSDQAVKVIEKLSGILDYTLYGCNDEYVSVLKEVVLIENYLALEKIRYGKRVNVKFINEISKEVKIAPLLLLTYIENAFKHGVSQELKSAEIDIHLKATDEQIYFKVRNSKTNYDPENSDAKNNSIGLKNINQQLELLYPGGHSVVVTNTPQFYEVQLTLHAK